MLKIYVFAAAMLILGACSNESSRLATDLCDCMKKSGLKKGMDSNGFPGRWDEHDPCFQDISARFVEVMKPMNDSQRAAFVKDFSKAILETDCADIVFNMLPYAEMLEEMEEDLERKRTEKGTFNFFNFNTGVTVCDCVKMGKEMMKEADEAKGDEIKIKEIEEKYSAKMEACKKIGEEAAKDEELAKKLKEEIKNCD